MASIAFPNMLSTSSTNLIVSEKEAVKNNLLLLLNTERKSLFGDPGFGSNLKRVMFEQEGTLIVDLLIDELYTTIMTFMPQLFLERRDISIVKNHNLVIASIKFRYKSDGTSDMLAIKLMEE